MMIMIGYCIVFTATGEGNVVDIIMHVDDLGFDQLYPLGLGVEVDLPEFELTIMTGSQYE